MTASLVARLKIALEDVEPQILRRVEVPVDIRLDRLHLVLQAALGWTNSHLYEIRAGGTGWGDPDPNWGDGPLNAAKTRLDAMLEDCGVKTFQYLYDFGDGWEHKVKVERILDAVPGIAYPRLIEAVGRCPPEDSGGPWGYAELLEAMHDPKHGRYEEASEWMPSDFDPKQVDIERLTNAVAELAMRWNRKPAVRKSKTA